MDKPQIINTSDLPVVTKRGGKLKVYAGPGNLGTTQLVMGNTILQSGEETIEHIHDYSEEIWYILRGTGTVLLENVVYNVNPGDVIFTKQGQKHKIINEGYEEMEFLFVSAPLAPSDALGHRDIEETE